MSTMFPELALRLSSMQERVRFLLNECASFQRVIAEAEGQRRLVENSLRRHIDAEAEKSQRLREELETVRLDLRNLKTLHGYDQHAVVPHPVNLLERSSNLWEKPVRIAGGSV